MARDTEMFIGKVRKYACLFDTSDEYFKDTVKKAEAWREISEDLGMTSESAKHKWKNLRDSYIRYKKSTKGDTGYAKKYHKWPWGRYMGFLDDNLKLRPQSSNVAQTSTQSEETASHRADTPPLFLNTESNTSSEKSPTSLGMPLQGMKWKTNCGFPEQKSYSTDVDKVIHFLEGKRKRQPQLDGVDYLFLSYAETFKKFQPRTQAMLKIELATLFARVEMDELDAQETPGSSSM